MDNWYIIGEFCKLDYKLWGHFLCISHFGPQLSILSKPVSRSWNCMFHPQESRITLMNQEGILRKKHWDSIEAINHPYRKCSRKSWIKKAFFCDPSMLYCHPRRGEGEGPPFAQHYQAPFMSECWHWYHENECVTMCRMCAEANSVSHWLWWMLPSNMCTMCGRRPRWQHGQVCRAQSEWGDVEILLQLIRKIFDELHCLYPPSGFSPA